MVLLFLTNHITMNPYRFAGDMSHVIATLVLLIKIFSMKSAKGVSGKTQILLTITYIFRYMDFWLMWEIISVYNSFMKAYYISVSLYSVYLIYSKFGTTYNQDKDSFRTELLIFPVTILAFFINHEQTVSEVSWTWSIYMEAVAMIPQFYMIWKTGKAEPYMIMYIFFFGMYRGMYILNWAYRYNYEGYYDLIAATSGIIETFIALFGFLCVVSQALSNMKDTHSLSTENSSNEAVYIIPLISDDHNMKANEEKKSNLMKHNTHLPL